MNTSGFRGIIGDTWTKENIQKLGFAIRQIAERQNKQINYIVGFDNRFMGRESAQWFCESIATDQTKITFMTESVPSPYITFKTNSKDYDFGIMITSSHNTYIHNGLKVFLPGGRDADDEFGAAVASAMENLAACETVPFQKLADMGIVTFSDNTDDYVNKIISLVDAKRIRQSNLRVLFNPMHGSSISIVKRLFEKLGVKLTAVNDNVDPDFGGIVPPTAYPRHLGDTAKQVVEKGFDCGFALDGDGDRFTFIDRDGKIYDCNFILPVLYYYLIEIKKQKGDIAKTFASSNLTSKLSEYYGFKTHETMVGSKFIAMHLMTEKNTIIGGEINSVILKQISLAREGIATAVMIIELLAITGKTVGGIIDDIAKKTNYTPNYVELAYPFEPSMQKQFTLKLTSSVNPPFAQKIIRRNDYPDGFKIIFAGGYFVAARVSGTENAVRFYVEMPAQSDCEAVIKTLEKFYGVSERQK